MTVLAARRRAERLVYSCGVDVPAVSVDDIAQSLGLRIAVMSLNEDLSGLLITQPGKQPTIIVEARHSLERRRFTIAHEIGHYFLRHHELRPGHIHADRTFTYRSARASLGIDPVEVEANQFAAALLMPTRLVQSAILSLGIDPHFDDDIQLLADTFKVRVQAMSNRLTTLRYW
jgi:Zn-dependent peptidase ImmA (M78 family)